MSEEIESTLYRIENIMIEQAETAFLTKEINSLTKREQFAMAAMQGLASRSECKHGDHDYIAMNAAKMADALLAELAKEKSCDTK